MAHSNKKLFFLSLLFITAATHCMEKNNSEFTLNSPDSRNESILKLIKAYPNIVYPYYRENHNFALMDYYYYSNIKPSKGISINGYSFIGFAAMAITVHPSEEVETGAKKYPEYAPYDDRKNFIKALLKRGWKPTQKDRELALSVEKEEGIKSFNGRSDLLDY